jgi:hypothetical protein
MHQVAAALAVATSGRVFAAHANARVALEFAATAQWIAVHPDGFDRYQKLLAFKRTKLIDGFHSANVLPGGNESYADFLKGMEDREAQNQTTKAIFESLAPNGVSLYAIYRQLCQALTPRIGSRMPTSPALTESCIYETVPISVTRTASFFTTHSR